MKTKARLTNSGQKVSIGQLKQMANLLDDVSLSSLAIARRAAHLDACGWHLNLSRNFLDDEADAALVEFGRGMGMEDAIEDLFEAREINASEARPALHWALRLPGPDDRISVEKVRKSLDAPLAFADKIFKAPLEQSYKTIVHIGIGGSDFGPRLLIDAFPDHHKPGLEIRFCSNVDPLDLDRALDGLDPKTTLLIGVSKSFTTEETLYNLNRAVEWMKPVVGDDWRKQVALITAKPGKAKAWLGQKSDQIFDLPDSVGGRFSLWSPVSLACMIACGADWFRDLLAGAHEMDNHVRNTPLEDNLAARLALLDYWNASIRGNRMRVALGYSSRLRLLPTHMQQLEMESNGKSVSVHGSPLPYATAPALWGGEGSVGQHSYHQWLHQGTYPVAVEFIIGLDPNRDEAGTRSLFAHALAQAEILANGRSAQEISRDDPDMPPEIVLQKVHPGGRPSTLLVTHNLTPRRLGALIALLEHRTYLVGKLWNVNSFDQWGVERGKHMASKLRDVIKSKGRAEDPVTQSIIDAVRNSDKDN